MLEQLVYTRCSPYRDLRNQGKIVQGTDGFGVASYSPGLLSCGKPIDFNFLLGRLTNHNGSKESGEPGLLISYEYTAIAQDFYLLGNERMRPHCQEPRPDGRSHRPGTFIEQALIGELEGYPAEWFGADVWDAHLKSENDYYHFDNTEKEPPLLNAVSATPRNGSVSIDRIRDFARDGREQTIQTAIWFLLQEYDKPENTRKVLLIRDIPENVELWIAAIEYGFSASMARKIGFTTNITRLAAAPDSCLFYYTDANGVVYPMKQNNALTRHPYYMIAGYHPKDSLCAALRQVNSSNFVLLDGEEKSIGIQPDESICSPYYAAVVQYGEDILDFCRVVLPNLLLQEPTGQVPALFDAYKYLLDSAHQSERWNYSDAVHYLGVLLQFGTLANATLSDYLLDECLRAYSRFAQQDGVHAYPMLKYMWVLAKNTNRQNEITNCVAGSIRSQLGRLTERSTQISETWQALKAGGITDVLRPVLRNLFADEKLLSYAAQFPRCDEETVETVQEMFFQKLADDGMPISTIQENEAQYRFVCFCLLYLNDDSVRLNTALRRLAQEEKLFTSIALSMEDHFKRKEPWKVFPWWEAVLGVCGGDIQELCRRLCNNEKTRIDTIENLLSNCLRKNSRFDPALKVSFADACNKLGEFPDTGMELFSTWIDIAPLEQFGEIVRTIRSSKLSANTETELFQRMDSRLPYDLPKGIEPMWKWAEAIKLHSVSLTLNGFRDEFVRQRQVDKAVEVARGLANMDVPIRVDFLRSKCFKEIVAQAAGFFSPELHIMMLSLFQRLIDLTLNNYVDAYTATVLSETKGRNMADQLVALCRVIYGTISVPNRKTAFVLDVQRSLNNALERHLPAHFKPSLIDQIDKYPQLEYTVRNRLTELLEEIDRKPGPKGLGGKFTNLFKKR